MRQNFGTGLIALLTATWSGCSLLGEGNGTPHLTAARANPAAADTLHEARKAVRGLPALRLRQSWRKEDAADFREGRVHFGWHEGSLVGLVELNDGSIGNRASGFNQRTWELGDAFEIFIRVADETPYYEFHVTPENQRLQMRWPAPGTLQREAEAGTLRHEDYFLPAPPLLHSHTWVQPDAQKWFVAFSLPLSKIAEGGVPPSRIALSFCRYDADAEGDREFSSTTKLPFAGFHEVQFWPHYRLPQ